MQATSWLSILFGFVLATLPVTAFSQITPASSSSSATGDYAAQLQKHKSYCVIHGDRAAIASCESSTTSAFEADKAVQQEAARQQMAQQQAESGAQEPAAAPPAAGAPPAGGQPADQQAGSQTPPAQQASDTGSSFSCEPAPAESEPAAGATCKQAIENFKKSCTQKEEAAAMACDDAADPELVATKFRGMTMPQASGTAGSNSQASNYNARAAMGYEAFACRCQQGYESCVTRCAPSKLAEMAQSKCKTPQDRSYYQNIQTEFAVPKAKYCDGLAGTVSNAKAQAQALGGTSNEAAANTGGSSGDMATAMAAMASSLMQRQQADQQQEQDEMQDPVVEVDPCRQNSSLATCTCRGQSITSCQAMAPTVSPIDYSNSRIEAPETTEPASYREPAAESWSNEITGP